MTPGLSKVDICEIISEIKVTARSSALNRMRLPASALNALKAA